MRKITIAASALSLVALALPVWALHIDSVSWVVSHPMTIGNTQVKPGSYELRAEEGKSEVQVVQNGKFIATAPCHWTDAPNKVQYSQVTTDNDQVTKV
jgi:hypothetical protein